MAAPPGGDMGLWDKVKSFFGGGPSEAPPEDEPRPKKKKKKRKRAADAGKAVGSPSQPAARAAKPAPTTPAPFQKVTPGTTPPKKKKKKKKVKPKDPYAADKLLGLSMTELRKRAMQIRPWATPWIGRVDVIPPRSDERTALIDRGLVLRGFLTDPELDEIHKVGDAWLVHREAHNLASTKARAKARQAVEDDAAERARFKAEKKAESARKKEQRRAQIAERHATDIIYLGRGVSKGLADRRSHIEKLKKHGLPMLSCPADIANALGITIPKLRWLTFHSEAATRTHYVRFTVPKRSGGERTLAAPHRDLAAAQKWVLDNILNPLDVETPAHGFVRSRSTLSNAKQHLGQDVVINQDLSDFFPTITFARVRGVFESVGYSPAAATVLALICTESPRKPVTLHGERLLVAVGDRALPQGACTSPALSNQVARKLDRRLLGMAKKAGWTYTRYADDLSLSAPAGKRGEIGMMLARVRHIVQEEGFAMNPKKGRVERRGGRQSVTGIVVNDKPSVPRQEVRRLRAILHQAKKTGLAAQNRDNHPHFEAHIRGRIAYLHMVDPDKAQTFLTQLNALTTSG